MISATQTDAVSRLMSCVLCPRGHAVAVGSHIPPTKMKITCIHCEQTFAFEQGDVQQRIMIHDNKIGGWREESFMMH